MRRTKTLRTAIFAVFFAAIATFATQPAHAKFGMGLGYKYVTVQSDLDYGAHVGQLDFLWTIQEKGKSYRDGGKRPYQVFGFGLAYGGTSGEGEYRTKSYYRGNGRTVTIIGVGGRYTYFAIPLIYEYVFANGLGISGGLTFPVVSGSNEDLTATGIGFGFGVSDLGVNYHLNNGLTFSIKTNLGYTRLAGTNLTPGNDERSLNGFMLGIGIGIGKWL